MDADQIDRATPPGGSQSAPMLGRERELERILLTAAEARAGSPRAVFVVGDAGIGKSRLLAETMTRFREDCGSAGLGRCVDETGMPPFLPWIELGASLRLPALSDVLLGPVDDRLAPESRRIRLYGSVCALLAEQAAERPLLLAFDDLQWSDPASNQLLRYALAHLGAARLLVLGSFREQEARANPELRKTLGELERERVLTRIALGPLPPAAANRLILRVAGAARASSRAAIGELSGGNPFLIEQFARELAAEPSGDPLGALADPTAGIGAVVAQRLDARPEVVRETVALAAIAGRDVSSELLAGALGRGMESVIAALDQAVAAGLLRSLDAGDQPTASDYAFVHDRIRAAVLDRIASGRRRALHGAIANALHATGADDLQTLAQFAHHAAAARRHGDATAGYERLGDRAQALGAFADAALAYERAVALRPRAGGGLLLKLGDARLHAGQPEALDAYAEAERVSLAANDGAGAAAALARLGAARARREEHELAVACLRAAEAAWARIDGTADELIAARTELCAVLGTSLGRYDEATAVGSAALEGAAALAGRPDLEARARFALAGTRIRAGELDEGRRVLEPALTLALQAHQRDLAAEIAGTLANEAYWTGDLPASERFARQRRTLGIESKDPYALRHTLPWLANIAMARGQWAAARALIAEAEADLARIDSPEPRAFLKHLAGMIALQQGEHDLAIARLEEAMAGFRAIGPGALPWYLGVLAAAYHAAGAHAELERTVAETEAVVAALPAGALPRAPSIAQLGLIAAQTGDAGAMSRWQTELQTYRGQFHWVLMDRALGTIAAELGETAAAERHLADAITTAARGQILPELLLVRAERARGAGQTAELESVAGEIASAGMAVPARYRPTATSAAASRRLPAGLTEREVEVLVLVAHGMTNREIADRLSISEKTVTNHLTHVFTKADLENRAAAVAFAHRHGMIQ